MFRCCGCIDGNKAIYKTRYVSCIWWGAVCWEALAMVVWTGLMFYLTIQYDRWCDRDDLDQ